MFSTQEAAFKLGIIDNVVTAVSIIFFIFIVLMFLLMLIFPVMLLYNSSLTMFSTQEAFIENGVTAVSIVFVAIPLLVLCLVVIPMLSIGVKLLLLSFVWFALYYLQRVLVGKRRCSRDWYVQYTAIAAYYLPTPVALSAASALYHFPSSHIHEHTSHFPSSHIHEHTSHMRVAGIVGLFILTILFSCSPGLLSSMRAYSLGDRRRNRSDLLMWLVFLGSIEWEWPWTTGPNWRGLELLQFLLSLLYIGILCMTAGCILFFKPAESTLDCQTKAVADYMKRRKSSKSSSTSSPFFDVMSDADADSMSSQQLLDCCRYPFVKRKGKEGEWITVQDLFRQCEDDDGLSKLTLRDKEICLSYSLSRLLARRYYGFHCAEEGDDIVRRFVLADLQPTDIDGYDRAFRIVEVQLAFLHDYFFTASFKYIKSGFRSIDSSLLLLLLFIYIILVQLDWTQTFLVSVLFICVGWCAVFGTPMRLLFKNLVASYWRPIYTAFRNLKRLSDRPLSIPCLVTFFCSSPNAQHGFDPFQTEAGGAYWSNKLGQYSILQDFNRHCSLKKEIVAWFKGTILSEPSYKFIKHLPVEEKEVDIKDYDSMRKLVADTLGDIDGPPTNGTKSLKKNRDSSVYDDWLWTCRQETHTHTILIWHIATCYCDMSRRHNDRLKEKSPLFGETQTFHKDATALSRYCAYLVAFLPEFLPEHSLITKQVFQRVLKEAKDALGSTHMEEKEKYTKIAVELPLPDEKTTTFHKGVWLGQQLEKLEVNLHWKVMAKFWAETILYIAPSDNAEAHIEHLAKGGEFITHLWAMLSNAGILKRATGEWHPPPTSTTTGGPLTQTEITDVQTQGSIVPSNDEAPTRSSFSTPRGPPKKIETTKARAQECPF